MSSNAQPATIEDADRAVKPVGHAAPDRRRSRMSWRVPVDLDTERWRDRVRRRLRINDGMEWREAEALATQAVYYRRLVVAAEELHAMDWRAWLAMRHELAEAERFLVELERRCAGEPAAKPGADPLDRG